MQSITETSSFGCHWLSLRSSRVSWRNSLRLMILAYLTVLKKEITIFQELTFLQYIHIFLNDFILVFIFWLFWGRTQCFLTVSAFPLNCILALHDFKMGSLCVCNLCEGKKLNKYRFFVICVSVFIYKTCLLDWRAGPVGKSSCCSCRGPGSCSQHPC